MSLLSDKYSSGRIGLALDLSDFSDMYQDKYYQNKNIYDIEIGYWKNCIKDNKYELYSADIDTTFCLINKNYLNNPIRIAGSFTAKHLPWYTDLKDKIFSVYENYASSTSTTYISTISKVIIPYIENNYIKVHKNDEYFFILNDENDINLNFWKEIYTNWEVETFYQFDKLLSTDKIFIDIGGWIGTTCIYGSRKSKYVYVIEADKNSFNDMKKNIEINNKIIPTNFSNISDINLTDINITLINKAIYNIDNIDIPFGKNRFISNSKINDSTSQIYHPSILDLNNLNNLNDLTNSIKTISLESMIKEYNIDVNNISLIKVDIEGGEEFILNDLFILREMYNIPLYISFHYNWWIDKNISRFSFLTTDHINNIINNPFITILFE